MCLLMTVVAAMAASLAWYRNRRKDGTALEILSLMYWGAALMWSVDGFFRLAEAEPFFEITLDDALLGLLVVAAGLIVCFALRYNPWRTCKAGN
ncbi:MAG: hypothetical protein LBC91_03890 [Candidatus Accumulibacter sp.]|jgi:hypothetical protein|nr:hypothetical protein [Accumulibacter sp.]